MEPFTLNQAIVAGLLFLLGLLIGMFMLAGGKWKRRYRDEVARREVLEQENARLGSQLREHESLRHAAAKAPVQSTTVHEETRVVETPATRVVDTPAEPYRRVTPTSDGSPDIVIRRP